MTSIDVIFEVLPEDGPGDRTPTQALEELRRQLADPRSTLRSGEFARYAGQASLTAPGIATDTSADAPFGASLPSFAAAEEPFEEPPPPPLSRGLPVETVFANPVGCGSAPLGSGPYGTTQGGVWGPQGPYDMTAESQPRYTSASMGGGGGGGGGDWQGPQGLSNTEIVDKISRLEQMLARTAAGGADPMGGDGMGAYRQEPPPSALRMRGASNMEVEAMEEKCMHYQQRLEAVDRELRESQESARMYRSRSEQLEVKLKEREQLLAHAKEMWMKENVRASKLSEQLTAAEDRLADQEKRLGEVAERYNEAQQEVRQLQHLVGSAGGFMDQQPLDLSTPTKAGRPAMAAEAAFTGDLLRETPDTGHRLGSPGGSRPRLAGGPGRPDSADLAGGTALPFPFETETNADRYRRLCLLNDAVLYEDELIQIGIKAEYSGREAHFAVFFGNKGSAALQAFTVQYFVREEQALKLTASPLSQQLDADKQVVQRVSATCMEPFVHPVGLRIQFLLPDTSPRRIQLRFPLTMTKFMAGRELSAQDFFRYWRQQQFVLNEVTSIVHLAARLQGQLAHIARSIVFGSALRLHPGIDTNPDNFVLVSQLAGRDRDHNRGADRGLDDFGLGGDRENGLTLVRVEVGNGRFTGKARIVVRSSDPTVARAICDCIVLQLAESNAPQSSEVQGR